MSPPSTLLVSYTFPPAGGVVVQRALALARYLPQAGCSTHVLTARNPVTHVYDPALAERIPSSVAVHRVGAVETPYALRQAVKRAAGLRRSQPATAAGAAPSGAPPHPLKQLAKAVVERLVFPDPQRNWSRAALSAASRLIERERLASVLITVPPFSLLRMAVPLRRRFPDLRIVLDFRDEWLEYHLNGLDGTASAWKRARAAELEAAAVAAADFVVTVTPTWVERLRRRYATQPASKFVLIPNGYDPGTVADLHPTPPLAPPLVVSYLGTLYANPVYTPQSYLQALDLLGPEWYGRIETRFIGRVAPEAAALLENGPFPLVQTGFLPQDEALARLQQSHCLLLLLGTADVHSGKLFEYLATGLPILAVTPHGGEAARVIEETGAGLVAAPDNPVEIAAALQRLYAHATGAATEPLPTRHPERIAVYDRSVQARTFAGLLQPR